ncbi:MAG: hypothetical protein A3G76_09950 [Acidobacteria bacterium RIFCSPLOWO2_12_FULL_65_11]|nr:MAG: hypothetical protein A3H95_04630 [Acidobacteria bacterium RIFCSPLOWO2_02_FULL_64_15]OFW31456.1 MAG: hypothetical protein A3G76_09950 [Acidobacteria bacterium RIFCSPLOWO2_12_FULL_65_11]
MHARPFRQAPVRRLHVEGPRPRREAVESALDVVGFGIVALEEEPLYRARALHHLPHDPQERDQIDAPRPPMDETGEGAALPPRIEGADVRRRVASHDRRESLDRLQDARHASEGERRRAESHDLAIGRPLVPTHDLNRIGRRIGIVEALVQTVEGRLQFNNVRPFCNPAILQSCNCMIASCAAVL